MFYIRLLAKTETTLLGPLLVLQPGMWKRKRLIFCGSGIESTLTEEVGSGSKLGSESVENELEAEAIFS